MYCIRIGIYVYLCEFKLLFPLPFSLFASILVDDQNAIRHYHNRFVRRISVNSQQQAQPQPPPIRRTGSQSRVDKKMVRKSADDSLLKKRPPSSTRKSPGPAGVKRQKDGFALLQETPIFTAAHNILAPGATSINQRAFRKHLAEDVGVKKRLTQLGIGLDASYVAPLVLHFMKAPRNVQTGKMVQPFVAPVLDNTAPCSAEDREEIIWKWIRPIVPTNEVVEMPAALKKGLILNQDVIREMHEMETEFVVTLRGPGRGATTKKAAGSASADPLTIFHAEERLRFAMPELPFTYGISKPGLQNCPVAPIRKEAQKAGRKPREHNLLMSTRPAHASVLAIMRDAAARSVFFLLAVYFLLFSLTMKSRS